MPFTPSDDTVTVTYDGTSNEQRRGGLLIDLNGVYISDVNGTRIVLGGLGTTDTVLNEVAVTYVPDTDVL